MPVIAVVATLAAFTFLNPHVYLDTVLLLGGLGARHPAAEQPWFVLGASLASVTWFFWAGLRGEAPGPAVQEGRHVAGARRADRGSDVPAGGRVGCEGMDSPQSRPVSHDGPFVFYFDSSLVTGTGLERLVRFEVVAELGAAGNVGQAELREREADTSNATSLAELPLAAHDETRTSDSVRVVVAPSLSLAVSVRLGNAFPVATAPNSAGLHPSNAFWTLRSDTLTFPAPPPPPAFKSTGLLAPQLQD